MSVQSPDVPDTQRGMFHFRFLAAGHAIAAYGNFLNMVALSLFTYHVTGSALHTGLFMALRIGSGFLAGFPAGTIVNRVDRKYIIVAVNLVQATAMTTLWLSPQAAAPIVLYILAVVIGAAGTLTSVALRSAVPEIVGPALRVRANGWIAAARSVSMVAGFASSGVLIAAGGYTTVFAVNIGAFVLAAATVAPLPIHTAPSGERAPVLESHRRALRYLADSAVLRGLLTVRSIVHIGAAAANAAIPIHSTAVDPGNPATFMAQFWTLWAVGNMIVQPVLVKLGLAGERTFVAGACLMSAAVVLVFADGPLVVTLLAALLTGIASGAADTSYHSRLQEVPDDKRGYLFGLSMTVENFSFGMGLVAAALLLDSAGPLPIVATISAITICAALAFGAILIGTVRDA